MYLLTDEKGNRPLKTYAQIQNELAQEVDKLALVLEIFVASGLVMLLPEVPAARYQLVHDYLVTFIRQQGKRELKRQLTRTEQALAKAQQKIQSMIRRGRMVLAMSSVLAVTVVAGTFIWAVPTIREARKGTQIERVGMTALRQFESQEIEALFSAIQSGEQLSELIDKNRPFAQYPATSPLLALQTILDNIHEKNRLSVDQNKINDVSFSPDGQHLVTVNQEGISYRSQYLL